MTNKNDLIKVIESLQSGPIKACQESIEWVKQQPDLDTALNTAPPAWWLFLVIYKTQYAVECSKRGRFKIFEARHWLRLLRVHPQLVKYCQWSQLDDRYKKRIIKGKPVIEQYIKEFADYAK